MCNMIFLELTIEMKMIAFYLFKEEFASIYVITRTKVSA